MPDLKLLLEMLTVILFGIKRTDESQLHLPYETKTLISEDDEKEG